MFHRLTRILQGSPADAPSDSFKRPRRSERLSQKPDNEPHKTPISTKQQLPSPVTNLTTEESSVLFKEATATPPEGRPSQVPPRDDTYSQVNQFSSPPQDTQAFLSQHVDPNAPLCDEVQG